jgi:hypothetical protein
MAGDGRGIGEPDLVAAFAFDQAVQTELFREPGMPGQAVRQGDVEPAVDVALADLQGGERLLQHDLVGEGLVRMRVQLLVGRGRQGQVGVVDAGLAPDRERQHHRALLAAAIWSNMAT